MVQRKLSGYMALALSEREYRIQKLLLILGAIMIAVGFFWPIISRLSFGKLPLDFSTKVGNAQVFFPLGTCILLSIILSVLFKLFR